VAKHKSTWVNESRGGIPIKGSSAVYFNHSNWMDKKQEPATFIKLAQACDYKAVELALKENTRVSKTHIDSAVIVAARQGCFNTTRLLLEHGADAKNLGVSFALAEQALNGKWNISRLLHEHGAKVDPLFDAELTKIEPPLESNEFASLALMELYPCKLKPGESGVFMETELRELQKRQKCLKESLHNAVASCRPRYVKSLLAAGYDPDKRDENGLTPLMIAAVSTCPKCHSSPRIAAFWPGKSARDLMS